MAEYEPPILVSACLAGVHCRYDGKDNLNPRVLEFIKGRKVILMCPELMGGLPTPRPASGRDGDKIVTIDQKDVTSQFKTGAETAAWIAVLNSCQEAILKARSPSCGVGKCIGIGKLKGGDYEERDGVLAEWLRTLGLTLRTEEDL
jgi:uncharacterized protein YbbK (DUF523 family)